MPSVTTAISIDRTEDNNVARALVSKRLQREETVDTNLAKKFTVNVMNLSVGASTLLNIGDLDASGAGNLDGVSLYVENLGGGTVIIFLDNGAGETRTVTELNSGDFMYLPQHNTTLNSGRTLKGVATSAVAKLLVIANQRTG